MGETPSQVHCLVYSRTLFCAIAQAEKQRHVTEKFACKGSRDPEPEGVLRVISLLMRGRFTELQELRLTSLQNANTRRRNFHLPSKHLSATSNVVDQPNAAYFRTGLICILSAHVLWGLFPLYWRLLSNVPSATLLSHRIAWSFAWLFLLGCFVPRLRRSFGYLRETSRLKIYAFAALMIGINWGAFLYAVNSGQVLQSSLGYYINPLFNVLLGVIVLGEKMDRFQWAAIGLATIGVTLMAMAGSGVPWIALTMATAFALYGLAKKKAPLPALEGLTLETTLLLPLALIYFAVNPSPSAESYPPLTWVLLVTGGLITIIPLTLFAVAAKRVTLTTIGIAQYVGPTMQWFVGVVVLGEPFGMDRLVGFVFVWIAVAIFITGSLIKRQRMPRLAIAGTNSH